MRKLIKKVPIFLHYFQPLVLFANFMMFLTCSVGYKNGDIVESIV
jgi:hypothetical protein